MDSPNITVVGLQWGDEGKGKVVDALCRVSKYVVRFCGGANAGHTVVIAGRKFALHLIPCGVFHNGVVNVIGNGIVFDPPQAIGEIDGLIERGIGVGPANLRISAAAQVVMPWHKLEDRLSEQSLGADKIGTTARGIGPCYADKARRTTAVRVGDLLDAAALRDQVTRIADIKNRTFAALYQSPERLDPAAIADEYAACGRRLGDMICNTGVMLRAAVAAGEPIFFEGGQGSMLDIDHGTYPYVTSSSVSACGVSAGAGVPPSAVGRVVGVMKAYTTRVGAGPFPTEQDNATGSLLRERGHEYGTTTGRARRCGWLDAFAARYAADLSGVDELALSLLDVLCGLDEISICTAYLRDGKRVDVFEPSAMAGATPVYETLQGWKEDIAGVRRFADLPPAAQKYVQRIEQLVGRPVGVIGVGADREATILHHTKIRGLP
jgi:adenylosuccinate synthase